MLSGGSRPYRVVSSDAFQSAWRAGVRDGWLNPMVHPAQVEYFTRSVLPTRPHLGEPAQEVAANVLAIRFPRSPRSLTLIEIVYAIVEDDRTVTLMDINLLPGADYEG